MPSLIWFERARRDLAEGPRRILLVNSRIQKKIDDICSHLDSLLHLPTRYVRMLIASSSSLLRGSYSHDER